MGESSMWKYMAGLSQKWRGGEMCRGCGQEKENAQHVENFKEFEKRIGIKMEWWWMGLTGRIDEGLLEIIRKIDEEQKNEGREDRQWRDDRERRRPETWQGNWIQVIYLFIVNICTNYVLLLLRINKNKNNKKSAA